MNNKINHKNRGISGLEAAILMVVIVIIAAALAFVVLNMGFSTTQKAKSTIVSSLGEASSVMEVVGNVFGYGDTTNNNLKVLAVPIKVASGGDSVNLANTTTSVKYLSNSVTYDNVYAGTLSRNADGVRDSSGAWGSLADATFDAYHGQSLIGADPVNTGSVPSATKAFIYWTVNINNNNILDQGEHAVLAIAYKTADKPAALDKVKAEIIVPTGAALTVERQVPLVSNTYVNLG